MVSMMVRIDNASHRLAGYLPEVGRHLLTLLQVHAGIDNYHAVFALDHYDIGEVIPYRAVHILPNPVDLTFKQFSVLFQFRIDADRDMVLVIVLHPLPPKKPLNDLHAGNLNGGRGQPACRHN
jgi:hypothetical protein